MPSLGVLQDKNLPHVPGTAILEEVATHYGSATAGLKHGTGRNSHIILVPQPSGDPNDPLNWPQAKKLVALGVTCFGSLLFVSVIAGLFTSSLKVIADDTHVSIQHIVLTQGYQFLVVGVSGPIYSALSRKYGTRPIFLFGSVAILVGSIVGSADKTYTGILTMRIIQGVGMAPYESLIFTLISDLFFVHERGVSASIIQFVLVGVANLTSTVAGKIATTHSWPWL